jgi:hypothetical protein
VVENQVMVFWVVTPYSVVIGYQHFRRSCCLHCQGEVNGAGKRGRVTGMECKKGQHPAARRKQERTVILVVLVVGGEQFGVLDHPLQVWKGRQGAQFLLIRNKLCLW